jgi:hypothetical protein
MRLPNVNELIVCRRKESQLGAFEIHPRYAGRGKNRASLSGVNASTSSRGPNTDTTTAAQLEISISQICRAEMTAGQNRKCVN